MLVRANPCYPVRFTRNRMGTLVITRRWIFATGKYAFNYAN